MGYQVVKKTKCCDDQWNKHTNECASEVGTSHECARPKERIVRQCCWENTVALPKKCFTKCRDILQLFRPEHTKPWYEKQYVDNMVQGRGDHTQQRKTAMEAFRKFSRIDLKTVAEKF